MLEQFKIAVLVLAFFGVTFLLRRLFYGSTVRGIQSPTIIYPSEGQKGFPATFYVGNRKMSDFSVPKDVYDFRVPISTPNLSNLRKPVSQDLEKAKKLFIPNFPGKNRKPRK